MSNEADADKELKDRIEILEQELFLAAGALDFISGALDSWDHEEALHRVVDIAQNTLAQLENRL